MTKKATEFKELELAIHRYRVFLRDCLEPAVYSHAAPLAVEARQFQDPAADPPSFAAAVNGPYQPAPLGWRWGPKWSTTWFRLAGAVPPTMAGRPVALRFSSGTEALLYSNRGVPVQGLDTNRDAAALFASAAGGEPIRLHIEAACNHPFGVLGFEWDHPELRRRWESPEPGILERAELAVFNPQVWDLRCAYAFALGLLVELPTDSSRHHQLSAALRRATNLIHDTDVPGSSQPALAVLNEALRTPVSGSTAICHAVGHAHIDTAWLWPLRETRRKCARTFATALRSLDRFPDFRFAATQPQQYAWIEANHPALFEQIQARVAEGRWDAAGAMWIEPDANIISAESLIRQILHADRYNRSRFGDQARPRVLFLPDTFGFCASLPQIMAQAGLDTFITNKIIWSQFNIFPHTTFRWRGLDGTEVLAHFTPGHDYNSTNSPKELRHGEAHHRNRDLGPRSAPNATPQPARFLQAFGYGDGGGGPTDWMIRYGQLAADCDGVPRTRLSTITEFCAGLHADHASLRAAGEDLPVWSGELYLELHRGTLTTQGRIKRANLQAEQSLRFAELVAFAGPRPPGPAAASHLKSQLDRAWKLTLLNQFHDIIPGSSIGPVYDEARKDHHDIADTAESIILSTAPAWTTQLETSGFRAPIAILNPASTTRSGVVELPRSANPALQALLTAPALAYAPEVPPLGIAVVDAANHAVSHPARVESQSPTGAWTITNGLIRAAIDPWGRVVSLRYADSDREAGRRSPAGPAPLNQLILYEDRPIMWDAWDIDWYYTQKPEPVNDDRSPPASIFRVRSPGPLRVEVEVARPLGRASSITQIFRLDAGSRRLDIVTRIDWQESRRLLRALFPVDIHAGTATFGTQLGHLQRPTHRNTPWDAARFEVCAHRWADLSEPGFGVALLADSKYGFSAHDSTLGLSLLRSPKWPDPQADMGTHEFTYSLMPHVVDWRAAGVDAEGEALAAPLRAIPLTPFAADNGAANTKIPAWAPLTFTLDGPASIAIDALKPAEDDEALILRFHESHGAHGAVIFDWNFNISSLQLVDLLERPIPNADDGTNPILHRANPATGRPQTRIPLRPFQLVSLAIRR